MWYLASRFFVVFLALGAAPHLVAQSRLMQPEDLFRIEGIGAITWSPDRSRAAVEIHRPGRWLHPGIPTAAVGLVEAASGTLRIITTSSAAFVGFFGAAWSPDSRRLVLLSADTNAVVRPWLWTVGEGAPRLLPGLELRDGLGDSPIAQWADAEHVVLMIRDSAGRHEGPLYFSIARGKNVADAWTRAREGRVATASVLESRGKATPGSESRIVAVNARTGAVTTIARGAVHRPRLSADRRTLTFRREDPPLAAAPVATYFGPDAQGDAAYALVNWGAVVHHVDPRTGTSVPAPDTARPAAPASTPTLRVTKRPSEGTRLLLTQRGGAEVEVWRGNAWAAEIRTGRAEAIAYKAADGTSLTGWLLYPPGYVAGQRIPVVTVVYPGMTYSDRVPRDFDILNPDFEHPQLFAALGYGVLLPSMPAAENPLQTRALDALTGGVLPLLDTLTARGLADSSRIAVLGQSAGAWATLGMIARTDRFRTAIASASYANLVSLYGTFYGQYRYRDAGSPQRAQVLRMLQFERGYYGAGGPPWEQFERYWVNSPIALVARVRTPLLLVHGEADFIPVQQAEEFFTALYRQDKRVTLVRYAGEEHTITARANVLDLWGRFDDWLRETMPVR